ARGTDRAAQAFADSFTKLYPELADRSPVYAQLRNLIDMSVVAAFIQQQNYYSQADWNMDVFGNESVYPIETYSAPKFVESAVNAIWKGNTLMTPIGGGVNIQPRQALAENHLQKDLQGELTSLRERVDVEQLAPGQWWWD